MTEIRFPPEAARWLETDLVETVTAISNTGFGFDDDTGRFFIEVDDFSEVDRVLEAARDHGFRVEFDGESRLTFVPPDGDE